MGAHYRNSGSWDITYQNCRTKSRFPISCTIIHFWNWELQQGQSHALIGFKSAWKHTSAPKTPSWVVRGCYQQTKYATHKHYNTCPEFGDNNIRSRTAHRFSKNIFLKLKKYKWIYHYHLNNVLILINKWKTTLKKNDIPFRKSILVLAPAFGICRREKTTFLWTGTYRFSLHFRLKNSKKW